MAGEVPTPIPVSLEEELSHPGEPVIKQDLTPDEWEETWETAFQGIITPGVLVDWVTPNIVAEKIDLAVNRDALPEIAFVKNEVLGTAHKAGKEIVTKPTVIPNAFRIEASQPNDIDEVIIYLAKPLAVAA